MSRRWVRWMPAAAMPAVVAGFVLAGPIQAAVPPQLPAKTAGQLLGMVAASHATAFSGTVEQTVDLGLPQLPDGAVGSGNSGAAPSSAMAPSPAPGAGGGNGLSPSNISALVAALSTPHTARVYVDGAAKVRIQVLDRLAERDFIRNGDVAWSYDSSTDAANRWELPTEAAHPAAVPTMPVRTPGDVAAKALQNLDPGTLVSVGGNARVAGRDAYVLHLAPRATGTLVGGIDVAVDSQTGLPLRVAITSEQSGKTAFEVGFSQISLQAPAASVFAFTPPDGATVTRHSLPAKPSAPQPEATHPDAAKPHGAGPSSEPPSSAKPRITGTGWAAIVETTAGTVPADLAGNPALGMLLHQVDGGMALETTLFSILVTPDGRALAGAVPLAALQAAAAK